MRLPLAALAAAAVATAIGGAPAVDAHVERRSIHHTHTPCNPSPHTVEQVPTQPHSFRNAGATSRYFVTRSGPAWPSPTTGPTRRWQEATKARKEAPSKSPAALHPHHAEPSGAEFNYGPTLMLRSPRQSHIQIGAAAPTTAPQRPNQRSSASTAAPPTPNHHPHAPHRPPRACTLPITTTTTTTGHVKHMANPCHFPSPLGAHLSTLHTCRGAGAGRGRAHCTPPVTLALERGYLRRC